MSRYIDEDALKEVIQRMWENRKITNTKYNTFLEILDYVPTADVVEVKHGVWSLNTDDWFGDCYKCSACGEEFILNEGTPKDNGYNYCPHCGARMEESDEAD